VPLHVGNLPVVGVRAGTMPPTQAYLGTQLLWQAPANPDPDPDPDTRLQAAQLILDRMNSGLSIFEDWTWFPGMPELVADHNDVLVTMFIAANGGYNWPEDMPAAQAWLTAYIAADPGPGPGPDPTPGNQTLGVGGVATPPGAILATGNTTSPLNITTSGTPDNYRVYDGKGFTCGALKIRANYVVVQNYRVRAQSNLGISIGYGDAKVNHVVVQNNDVKDCRGPGDINAMEVWGDQITIAYNTAIDAITGDAGGSHTDFIQTWNTHGGWNTTNLRVIGNRATGEPDDAREHINTHYNQALIGEGAGASSGGGGSGVSSDWWIDGNYWTADCKFDDIDRVTFTRNTFAGIDKRAVVVSSKSTDFRYYSDNRIADGGRATVGIGASVIPGPGPATPHWYGKGGNFSNNPGAGGGTGGGGGTGTATLTHRVVGIPSTSSVPVAVRTANATSVRLQVSTSPSFASGIISGPAVTPNAQGDSQLTVSGLAAGTAYYHRVGVTSGGAEAFTPVSSVPFRTAPTGQANFAFCFSSCCDANDSAAMSAVAARNDAFFLHLGDLFYNDSAAETVANFRSAMVGKIQATNHKAVFATTPTLYTPSDHDGLADNSNADSHSAGWANWNAVYRELWPVPSRPGTLGAYCTFTWGRLRFIQIDSRSFASGSTRLGATQKQWLKDQITAATEPVIVIVQDQPWIGSSSGADSWSSFSTERTELANFFTASGKRIAMLGGDMHAVAAHNGVSGSPGGIAVFHAGPLNNSVSHKGGPYTVGPSPGSGSAQQYGRIVVTDTGTQIALAFTGYNSSNGQMLTLTKTYDV
jgi:hypothetical protein